ncbi:hypothetical protein IAQ61_005476 [Plenodomus lingam]|uniref:uncharacterized protein n=1 Tax=Leptosphaeria maculans TaxID=5022 RepID=UPI003326019A|nr:hypothetical protein IAQ61_005476 [Plenodomus lingam]
MVALAVQSWVLYAIATSLILSRIISRRLTLHLWHKLQADDWLMIFVLVPFTAAIVLANYTSGTASVEDRKLRFVLEELQIVTTWLVKACLLILYWRIFPADLEKRTRLTLQVLSTLCCLSFIIVQVSLLAWCRPVKAYWGMTATDAQCAAYHGHTIMTLIFTIIDTTLVMLLPIPFIPTPRRLLLAMLLFLGTMVLAAGIASRISILVEPASLTYLHWYTFETSLSIVVANLPFLTSLVVSATPARIRNLSRTFKTSSNTFDRWPRSRRESWAASNPQRLRMDRPDSTTTIPSALSSPVCTEKTYTWDEPDARHSGGSKK